MSLGLFNKSLLIKASVLPVTLFAGCKEDKLSSLEEVDLSQEGIVRLSEVSGLSIWKASLRETPIPLSRKQIRSYINYRDDPVSFQENQPLTLNTPISTALVNDLLMTTQATFEAIPELIWAIDVSPKGQISFFEANDDFSRFVDDIYRQVIKDPSLVNLLKNRFNIDDINCNEYAATYIATYIVVADELGIDISKANIQIHTGIYYDLNSALNKEGGGHMWLSINGKIHDPSAHEILSIQEDNYLPIVYSAIEWDLSQNSIGNQLGTFIDVL